MPFLEKDARGSEEWKQAEILYNQVLQKNTFLIVGTAPVENISLEELGRQLSTVLTVCPHFFPAWFFKGDIMLRSGFTPEGEEYLEKAIDCLFQVVVVDEDFYIYFKPMLDTLDNLYRYDLAVKFIERALTLFPNLVALYDELAYHLSQLPGKNKSRAIQMQLKSIELDPGNEDYINNLGWIYLQLGYLVEAEKYFEDAAMMNPNNEKTMANLETVQYMRAHQMTYFQYLTRPIQANEMDDLLHKNDDEAFIICRQCNEDRTEAFKIYHLENNSLKPFDILFFLGNLMLFVDEVELQRTPDQGLFLFENFDLFMVPFNHFLFHLIINSIYIERDQLGILEDSIEIFYRFLENVHLITKSQYEDFKEHIDRVINDYSSKLEEYYTINHNIDLTEKEREKAIRKLFALD